jgi:hypothetical protein
VYAIQQTVLALTGMDSGGNFVGGVDTEIFNNMDAGHHFVTEDLESFGTPRSVLSGSYPVRSFRKDVTKNGIIQGITTKKLYFDTTFIYASTQLAVR